MINMWTLKGIRVVRGPDWELADDEGEDCVGTIIQVDYNEEQVTVIWDDGREEQYPCTEDKHPLLILDNAPTGVSHKDVHCTVCRTLEIVGMRWVCLQCVEVNLCWICYMAEKHNTDHDFGRVTLPYSPIVKVGRRKASKDTCKKCRGLYPKARVKRGQHWKWGDSNGSQEDRGIIQDVCDWGSHGYRGAVRVCWEKKNHTMECYRVGGDGKVDLRAVKVAEGNLYYPNHLPYLDLENLVSIDYRIGDKVQINLNASELRAVQSSSDPGWQEKITSCVNNTGTVTDIPSPSQVRVQYQNGQGFLFQKIVLTKVHQLEVGDLVRVMRDKTTALHFQKGHGGWSKNQDLTLGRLGRVVHIDDDGDVSVTVADGQYLFSPVCLEVVDPNSLLAREKVPSVPNNLHSLKLFEFGETLSSRSASKSQLTSIVKAAAKGDVNVVKEMLKTDKEKVNAVENGVTSLQVASHKGHEKMVKFLLERGGDINKPDEEGNTPLHFAVHGKKNAIIKLLLEHKADPSLQNNSGQTAIHLAIAKEQDETVKALVLASCDVHVKDSNGDTAVHTVIRTRKEKLLHAVLRSHRVDFQTKNAEGYNMLQWAVYKNFKGAVEVILMRCSHCISELVSRRLASNCFTALHLAALYNYRDCAQLLITKGDMELDLIDHMQQTPLHISAEQGHLQMVELLLEFDIKINLQDKNGNSPLHLVQMKNSHIQEQAKGLQSRNSFIQIACLLVEHGAELEIKNGKGQTPLDFTCPQSCLYLKRISKAAKEKLAMKSGSSVSLPLHWSNMENKNCKLVSLDCQKPEERAEFSTVSSMIENGLSNAVVKEVIRVQNEYLWQIYSVTKNKFIKKYGRGNENEIKLLHGTKPENVFKICDENFDFKIAGENLSPMYGKGVYFAMEASLSDHYSPRDEKDGLKYVLMARVLAGKMATGSPELRKPPADFDCTVDYPSKPRIYCVFDYNQLYPEYIIKYKTSL
ncbi:E3 ubiquitin-protein ligase MIB1-like isoform X2 [Crassostrea virginica]